MTEYDAMKILEGLSKTLPKYHKKNPQDFPLLSQIEEEAVRLTYTKVEPKANIENDFRQWYPARMIYQGQEHIYLCFETRQYRPLNELEHHCHFILR